jgi:hypothetical protein
MPTPFTFRKYGQSGIDVSEIFPHIASHVDELAVIRSMYSMSNDHVQAVYALQSGVIRMGFPCLGSWVTYGLGSENQNLPVFSSSMMRAAARSVAPPTGAKDSCPRPTRGRSSSPPALRSSI